MSKPRIIPLPWKKVWEDLLSGSPGTASKGQILDDSQICGLRWLECSVSRQIWATRGIDSSFPSAAPHILSQQGIRREREILVNAAKEDVTQQSCWCCRSSAPKASLPATPSAGKGDKNIPANNRLRFTVSKHTLSKVATGLQTSFSLMSRRLMSLNLSLSSGSLSRLTPTATHSHGTPSPPGVDPLLWKPPSPNASPAPAQALCCGQDTHCGILRTGVTALPAPQH